MNDYWHTISAMADRATRETGKTVTPDDVFNLARQGVIRVGANIPAWKCTGNGELEWFSRMAHRSVALISRMA